MLKPSVMALALLAVMPLSHAATLQLTWGDPEKFRDIRATDTPQQKYQEQIMKDLGEVFSKEAARMPADQSLKIEIKDLDLAGDIEYFYSAFPFGVRVVRNVDFPSMKLSYELRDGTNKVLKSGESDVSDMGFRDGIQLPYNTDPLMYEIKMIKKWYQHELVDSKPAVSMRQ